MKYHRTCPNEPDLSESFHIVSFITSIKKRQKLHQGMIKSSRLPVSYNVKLSKIIALIILINLAKFFLQ